MLLDGLEPFVLGKAAIVRMVVSYDDTLKGGVCLEGLLGLDRFFGRGAELQVCKSQLAVVVDEDCCGSIPLGCQPPLDLTDESWCR